MAKKAAKKSRKKSAKRSPKKKSKPRAAPKAAPVQEKSNWLTWVIVLVVIVALFLLIRGCDQAPEAVEEAAPEAEEPATEDQLPETAPGEIVTKEDLVESGSDAALAHDVTASPEQISNVKCSDVDGVRMISLKLTNVNSDRPYMISSAGVQKGFDTYFQVRGITVNNPSCGTESLAPGEATMCEGIGSTNPTYANIEGLNRVSIQAPNDEGLSRTEAVIVQC